jgi:hypothetical protein
MDFFYYAKWVFDQDAARNRTAEEDLLQVCAIHGAWRAKLFSGIETIEGIIGLATARRLGLALLSSLSQITRMSPCNSQRQNNLRLTYPEHAGGPSALRVTPAALLHLLHWCPDFAGCSYDQPQELTPRLWSTGNPR